MSVALPLIAAGDARGDVILRQASTLLARWVESFDDPVRRRAELIDEDNDELANPYVAAERGDVDKVIHPHDTRAQVIRVLRLLRTKRMQLPPKKHGNIPL